MIGKNSCKVMLAIINAYYDANNGYAHCSTSEINSKFGIALKNIPTLFKCLEDEGYIQDCTVNGFYKRFKILKPYPCPDFIFSDMLSTQQKNYLLKCLELNINSSMSKKEMCRLLHNSENTSNLNTAFNNIKKNCGKSVIELITDVSYITGMIPVDSIYTEKGYRTTSNRKSIKENSVEDKVANFLYCKSYEGFKHRKNIKQYELTPEIIKKQLIKQEMKDYYTGIIPDNYKDYSIDRIDSSKGYIADNVVITTNIVNIMKNEMSINEFKNQIRLFYNNINNY